MDKIAQEANRNRSSRGGSFESLVEVELQRLRDAGKIESFERKPKIFPIKVNGKQKTEFNPDFLVKKNDGEFISIDATTTARTDRMRAKQWDAYGTKLFVKKQYGKSTKIRAYMVVQEPDTKPNEIANFRRCKERCQLTYSQLDDAITLPELLDILQS